MVGMARLLAEYHGTFTEDAMPLSGSRLMAWIDQADGDEFAAAYVGSRAQERLPAVKVCGSPEEAREWVRTEAETLGVAVEWVPRRGPGSS